jgi:hypothetical protein
MNNINKYLLFKKITKKNHDNSQVSRVLVYTIKFLSVFYLIFEFSNAFCLASFCRARFSLFFKSLFSEIFALI